MKLVCVSHPCVASPNQEFYARVERLTGWSLTIVLPESWRNELSRFRAERWPSYTGALRPLRVLGSGSVPLHVYAARLGRILRDEQPDAVYVHNEPYALATIQVMRAVVQDVPVGFYSAQSILKTYPWPFRVLEGDVYRRASFAFPVSADVLAVLRTKGYHGPAEVLPLWVDAAVDRLPRRDGDGLKIGFVGRLVPEKGIDVLLEALALLPDDVRAVVAGAGPAAGSLRARASSLGVDGRVEWLGYVPHGEARGVIAGFDVLVVPSRSVSGWREQFGRVLLEALAVGVPVVASDCGELPRLIDETRGGWIFREGDARALARLVTELVADAATREQVATQGRAAIERCFSVDAVAARFVGAIEATLGSSSRARTVA